MSTAVQQPVPAVSQRRLTPSSVSVTVSAWFWRFGMSVMASLWVIIWGAIAVTAGRIKGVIDGLIVGAYAVLPNIAYVQWRGYRLVQPSTAG